MREVFVMGLGESIKYLSIAVIGTLYLGILVRLYLDKTFSLISILIAITGLTTIIIMYLFTPIIFLVLPFTKKFNKFETKRRTYFRIILTHPLDLTIFMFKLTPEIYNMLLVKAKLDAELYEKQQSQNKSRELFAGKLVRWEWKDGPWNEFKTKYDSYLDIHSVS